MLVTAKDVKPGAFDVYVDGERVHKCFELDIEEGFARCYATDAEGRIVVDRETDRPKVVEHRGKVEIRRVA